MQRISKRRCSLLVQMSTHAASQAHLTRTRFFHFVMDALRLHRSRKVSPDKLKQVCRWKETMLCRLTSRPARGCRMCPMPAGPG